MTGDGGGRETLAWAVWWGLAAGLSEATLRLVQRVVLDQRIFLGRDFFWMAPLADVALFALVGLALCAAGAILRRPIPERLIHPLLAILAVAGPVLAYPRLHRAAAAVLALGLGVAVGRVMLRLERRRTLRRRTWGAMAAVVLFGLIWVRGGDALRERRALAALPPPPTDAPNVLLIILDTVRAKSLGLYGYGLPTTPRIEALDGTVVFDRAWAPAPWTLPSHVSMFTGLPTDRTEADWLTPLGPAPLTLAEHLSSSGYATGGFVANLLYATWETGLQRGFARYEDYPRTPGVAAASSWSVRWLVTRTLRLLGGHGYIVQKDARAVVDEALDWIDGLDGRPYFAFLNFMDAHAPYVPPDSLYEKFGPRRTWRARGDLLWRRNWTSGDLEAERAAYDASIAYVDSQVGRLLDELEARGTLDGTLVVIASDHGEQLGEHGLVDHGNSLYRPLLHVPLVIRPPGATGSVRVDADVSLRHLPATISDLIGDETAPFPGRSLAAHWGDGEAVGGSSMPLTAPSGPVTPDTVYARVSQGIRMEEWLPAAAGDMESLVFGGFHFILDAHGRGELYALTDVEETTNLVDVPALAGVVETARRVLAGRGRP